MIKEKLETHIPSVQLLCDKLRSKGLGTDAAEGVEALRISYASQIEQHMAWLREIHVELLRRDDSADGRKERLLHAEMVDKVTILNSTLLQYLDLPPLLQPDRPVNRLEAGE